MRRFSVAFRSLALGAAVLAVGLVIGSIGSGPSHAARDMTPEPALNGARLEILVFETEACTYCEIFRRDVAPRYRFAPLASQAPLRFIDIGKVDVDKIGLAARLDILPTTVLMKDGKEVERITGLTAAETYYRLLQYMINKNE
jgi:thioredoxin-related protein